MATVRLNLYASLRQRVGGRATIDVPIEGERTVEQILEQLQIPLEEARIIFCDNRLVERTHLVQGGETIGVFPAIGGG